MGVMSGLTGLEASVFAVLGRPPGRPPRSVGNAVALPDQTVPIRPYRSEMNVGRTRRERSANIRCSCMNSLLRACDRHGGPTGTRFGQIPGFCRPGEYTFDISVEPPTAQSW